MFKVICVDHVGIACQDLDVSKKFYTDILGLECTGEEAVPEQGVKTVFIKCGETLIELLVDITENNDGPIGKYIAKNGQGIQHMALRVDDIKAAIAGVQEAGGRMIDKEPRGGAGGMDIAFIHPKSVGILLELCAPHKA
ncbi:MAG: methylmalonyl-CoA epimerase [Succiniclasticum sp.]|nr:methylmalonyl-CoA epimerase [Succiniclasticum sp.]MDY6086486.1 methylmalonyl-CoA epimerase [Succiniclasticum sp.]